MKGTGKGQKKRGRPGYLECRPETMDAFAANLRALRIARVLTQAKLAERSGVSRVRICSIERGGWNPRIGTAQGLAEALGVPVGKLIG